MTFHALFIGNNNYKDRSIAELKCAQRDASELYGLFKRTLGYGEHAHLLECPTSEQVMDKLEAIGRQVRATDSFLFFFAGHGVESPDNQDQYLLLGAAVLRLLRQGHLVGATGLLSVSSLVALTNEWEGVERVFVFDACRSDLEIHRGAGNIPIFGSDQVLNRIASRDGLPSRYKQVKMGGAAHRPSAVTGKPVFIKACLGGQRAYELPDQGHSIFSQAWSEALQQAHDSRQAVLTNPALLRHVGLRMSELAQLAGLTANQQPWISEDAGEVLLYCPPAEAKVAPTSSAPTPPDANEVEWLICCAMGRVEDYVAFVRHHPGSLHLGEALGKIAELSARVSTEAASPIQVATTSKAPTSAKLKQSAPAASRFRKLEALLQVAGCEACGEMARIEAGSFEMGAAECEPEAETNEKPRQRVTLKAFEIGRMVVTQGQWKAVMGDNPSYFEEAGDVWPVENISWDDAQEFLKKLNERTGKTYRLPTEAEWEYAALAGSNTAFWWGNHIDTTQANYDGNDTYNGGAKGEFLERTVEADSFEVNPWGLYNVNGNLFEWVQDAYHNNYKGAPDDGRAWEDGDCEKDSNGIAQRVVRCSSWGSCPGGLRSVLRFSYLPYDRFHFLGFRIARTP